jgi:cell wall-associated NlpC family hydrolase
MKTIKQTYHRFLLLSAGLSFLFGCASTKTPDILSESKSNNPLASMISSIKNEFKLDDRLTIFDVAGSIKNDTLFLTGETIEKAAYSRLLEQVEKEFKIPVKNEIEQLPVAEIGADSCALICVSVANLHPVPDIMGEIINQALMGSKVRLLKQKNGLHLAQMTDGYVGWISNSMLTTGCDSIYQKWDALPKVVVTTFWALVKSGKNNASPSVADVVAGNELALIEAGAQWTQVALPDGRQGFILSELLMEKTAWLAQAPATATEIVQTAVQLIGIPYQWGGTSIKGMDCSGFTRIVYLLNRIFLPRDAYMQAEFGVEILPEPDFKNLKPGDLLYFGKKFGRITHAGLYMGNMKFIHEEGMVYINSFNPADADYNEYRHQTLRKVRRVIGN